MMEMEKKLEDHLRERINEKEDDKDNEQAIKMIRENKKKERERKDIKKKKEPSLKPSENIDMDGNKGEDISRTEPQPLDWAEVVLPRRNRGPRPNLSESMNSKVNEELRKHVEEKYKTDNPPKTKPQKRMTNEQREKIITNMLAKSGLMVGVAPITRDHIDRVKRIMEKKGVFKKDEPKQVRIQQTVKSLIKSWTNRNLKMTDRDWDAINIREVVLTNNSDIVFIQCETQEDATQFTSRARNLVEKGKDSPRLVMYVDKRAMKRHKAFVNIARTIRDNSRNSIQTSLRTGKHDFLLRRRVRGSETPWNEIPPLVISNEIPQFEIGIYDDIVNPENKLEDNLNEDEQEEDDAEIERIAEDLFKQGNEEDMEESRQGKEVREDMEEEERKLKEKNEKRERSIEDISHVKK